MNRTVREAMFPISMVAEKAAIIVIVTSAVDLHSQDIPQANHVSHRHFGRSGRRLPLAHPDARIFTADNKDIGAVFKVGAKIAGRGWHWKEAVITAGHRLVHRQTADPGGAGRTPDNALHGICAGV